MLISDLIEQIITEMLNENRGIAEFGRNDLALLHGCVPSQINYVITSRFTKEKGYIVESRRGGGGFIKITRISFDRPSYLMHFINAIGEDIDYKTTKVFLSNLHSHELITLREMKMLLTATSDNVLKYNAENPSNAEKLRANIIKQAILSIVND